MHTICQSLPTSSLLGGLTELEGRHFDSGFITMVSLQTTVHTDSHHEAREL
jgi:hypothetical protein